MTILDKQISSLKPAAVAIAALLVSTAANAKPTVNGNVISWSDAGWHQVQNQATFDSICEGGMQCTVPTGVYIVINHTTGERFMNIPVVSNSPAITSAPLAATGQIDSYRFGDDGDYQSGVTVTGDRFEDNDDGTFTDRVTGIVWLGRSDCVTRLDWAGAIDFANALSANSDLCPTLTDGSAAGDWRLPNFKELYSLVNLSADTALIHSGMPFSGTWSDSPIGKYWTSTSFKPITQELAWSLDATTGQTAISEKEDIESVWPIRITD